MERTKPQVVNGLITMQSLDNYIPKTNVAYFISFYSTQMRMNKRLAKLIGNNKIAFDLAEMKMIFHPDGFELKLTSPFNYGINSRALSEVFLGHFKAKRRVSLQAKPDINQPEIFKLSLIYKK